MNKIIFSIIFSALFLASCNKDVQKTEHEFEAKIIQPGNNHEFMENEEISAVFQISDNHSGHEITSDIFLNDEKIKTTSAFEISMSITPDKYKEGENILKIVSKCLNSSEISEKSVTFIIVKERPTVQLMKISRQTPTTFVAQMNVVTSGGKKIVERGICFGKEPQPEKTEGSYFADKTGDVGNFQFLIYKLEENTDYYVRGYILTDEDKIYYGQDTKVHTPSLEYGTFTDSRDKSEYKYIKVGEQIWMAENLRYLPQIDNTTSEDEPRFYVYEYEGKVLSEAKENSNYIKFGALYNLPAALDGDKQTGASDSHIQGICPDGWHLPKVEDYVQLRDYLLSKEEYRATDEYGNEIDIPENEGGYKAYPLAKAVCSTSEWGYDPAEGEPVWGMPAFGQELNNATGLSFQPAGFRGGAGDQLWFHKGISSGTWTSSKASEDWPGFGCPSRIWSTAYDITCEGVYFMPAVGMPVRCLKNS